MRGAAGGTPMPRLQRPWPPRPARPAHPGCDLHRVRVALLEPAAGVGGAAEEGGVTTRPVMQRHLPGPASARRVRGFPADFDRLHATGGEMCEHASRALYAVTLRGYAHPHDDVAVCQECGASVTRADALGAVRP